ncbi:MAG: PEGA domain-containing protein [Terriglobia bacterium]
MKALLDGANALTGEQQIEEKLGFLRRAVELKPEDAAIRAAFSDTLVEHGHSLLAKDWRKAEAPIEEALEIDPGHALAKSLRGLLVDGKKQELVEQCLSRSLQLKAEDRLGSAIKEAESGLASFPDEARLTQLYSTLKTRLFETQRQALRVSDIEELKKLTLRSESVTDPNEIQGISELAQKIAQENTGDPEIELLATSIGLRLQTLTPPTETEPAGFLGEMELPSLGQETPIPTDKIWGSHPARREAKILKSAKSTVITLILGRGNQEGKMGGWQGRAGQLLLWTSAIVVAILLGVTYFHKVRPSKPIPTSHAAAPAPPKPTPPVQADFQTASPSPPSSSPNPSGNTPNRTPSIAAAAPSKRRHEKNVKLQSATNTRIRQRSSSKTTGEKSDGSDAENTMPSPKATPEPPSSPVNTPQGEGSKGEVDFQITPAGTDIFEGGRLLGRSPFHVMLRVGAHTLKLIPPAGWAPLEENYVVKLGVYGFSQTLVRLGTHQVNARTEPLKAANGGTGTTSNRLVNGGTLTVTTDPSGASILVDGTFYGRTPGSFLVAMGKHRLTISLTGLQTTEQTIFVPRHGHVPISMVLHRP